MIQSSRGFWMASGAAGAILAVGFVAVALAARRLDSRGRLPIGAAS